MQLYLYTFQCNTTNSGVVGDNVFLMIQADGTAPYRYPYVPFQTMNDGDYMDFPEGGLVIPFDYAVVVTAWDLDVTSTNEFLVNFSANKWSASEITSQMSNHNGASYSWDFHVAA